MNEWSQGAEDSSHLACLDL